MFEGPELVDEASLNGTDTLHTCLLVLVDCNVQVFKAPRQHGGRGLVCRAPRPKMARREGLFEGLELVDEASLNGTDTLHTLLLVLLHPGGWWARRSLAGMGPRPYVGATFASMYLCQQLQSFLPGDTLQFHTVRPLSVQDVMDELVSRRAVGQKKPCRNALPARALDPMWDPYMPPCISANSSSPSSRGMHLSFTPFGLLRYRTSSTNWYRADRRATFSASSCSLGSSPVWRNWTVCCAHAGAWGSTARTKGISSAMGAAISMAKA